MCEQKVLNFRGVWSVQNTHLAQYFLQFKASSRDHVQETKLKPHDDKGGGEYCFTETPSVIRISKVKK